MYKIISLLTDVWNGQYVATDWPSGERLEMVVIHLKGHSELSMGTIEDGVFIKNVYEKLYSQRAQIHLNGYEYEGFVVYDGRVNSFFIGETATHYYWYEISIYEGIQRLGKRPCGIPVDPVVRLPDLKDFPTFLGPSGVIRYKIDGFYRQKYLQEHL